MALENPKRQMRRGIGLGLRTLMATSGGDLYGVGILGQLRRYDEQLPRLQQGPQGAGQLRPASFRRYRVLVARLQGFLKTTIQTHLAKLLDLRRPEVVVIGDLLFAGQRDELSRRMNRLLRRFGQSYFTETLEQRDTLRSAD